MLRFGPSFPYCEDLNNKMDWFNYKTLAQDICVFLQLFQVWRLGYVVAYGALTEMGLD